MKTFIRRTATALVGAHITGAMAIYVIEHAPHDELLSAPLLDRVLAYMLAPYLLGYRAAKDLVIRVDYEIRYSAS